MGLDKLTIQVEKPESIPSNLSFGSPFKVLFNPDKLVFSKTVNWENQKAAQRDSPESQFTNSDSRTLKLDLLFDTYDPDDPKMKDRDVRTAYTDKILKLTMVDSQKHRPPICRLFWGSAKCIFQGILQQLEQQFTLFSEQGLPLRAKLSCTFKEWWTNYDDINREALESSDVAKIHIVKRGDTLSSIATTEYYDPKLWRLIANENGIDNPRDLIPGTMLLLPTVTDKDRVL